MKKTDCFLGSLNELGSLLKPLLKEEDKNDFISNIGHLRRDHEDLEQVNRESKNIGVINNHNLATKTIAISGRCFVGIIQGLQDIKDIVKHAKKNNVKRQSNNDC